MAKIPVRFKRVVAAFDEVARARFCESSGSEYSPENSVTDNLYDLVNSFIERDERDNEGNIEEGEMNQEEGSHLESDSATKERLQSLLGNHNDEVLRNIRAETEEACLIIGNASSEGFKRQLMTHLRERGFDAGICKSRWEKNGRYPSGNYEYIDVNISGTRYIVESFLSNEFEIARPTSRYISLLNIFPPIFIGKLEELKQIVRLMCTALRESLKCMDMHVPPWRKNAYMQAKWFGSYKRTINSAPAPKVPQNDEGPARKRFVVGFEASIVTVKSYRCREDFARKVGLKIGHLAAAFNGNGNGMHL